MLLSGSWLLKNSFQLLNTLYQCDAASVLDAHCNICIHAPSDFGPLFETPESLFPKFK